MLGKIKNTLNQLFEVYCLEFKVVFHDPGVLLFFLFLPLAYPVLYSLIYNPEVVREVKMVVVDDDRTSRSRELVRNLDATQDIRIIGYAADMGEAKRAMHEHECFGILQVPQGFGKKIGRSETANAVIYSDMSLLLRYRAFLMAVTNVMEAMGGEIRAENLEAEVPGAGMLLSAGDPLPINSIFLGNIEGGFDSFIMPGVIVLILHQCIILSVGMLGGASIERRRRYEYRTINQVKSVAVSMLGQTLCFLTILVLPMIFLIHYVPMIFDFPMQGSTLEIFAFLLPMVLSAIFMGFCLQSVITERETIFLVWVATSVFFVFLSGLTWPRFAMSPLWRFVGDIFPATWGVEGFIKMNSNGSTLSQVAHPYHVLWLLTGVYFILGYVLQRWAVRPQQRKDICPACPDD